MIDSCELSLSKTFAITFDSERVDEKNEFIALFSIFVLANFRNCVFISKHAISHLCQINFLWHTITNCVWSIDEAVASFCFEYPGYFSSLSPNHFSINFQHRRFQVDVLLFCFGVKWTAFDRHTNPCRARTICKSFHKNSSLVEYFSRRWTEHF